MGRPPLPPEELARRDRYGNPYRAPGQGFGEIVTVPASGRVLSTHIEPDPDWHPNAREVWDAFMDSPVTAARWLPTDLAALKVLCTELDAYYRSFGSGGGRGRAAWFAEIRQLLIQLGGTDMERRRARIEVVSDDGASTVQALIADQMAAIESGAYDDDE